MSVVLEVQPDGSYEPTQSEVVEYGKWLGMQLPEDEPFLWIAREGLKAPLPEPWKACKSERGDLYYFNFKTGQSIWDHPLDEHYKELFRSEKACPTPRSIAAGATRTSTSTPPPQQQQTATTTTTKSKATTKTGGASTAHKAKNNNNGSNNSEAATTTTAAAATGTRALRTLKLKKQLPDELRIDFVGTTTAAASDEAAAAAPTAAAAGEALQGQHDAQLRELRARLEAEAAQLTREHEAAMQARRDAHAAQLRRIDEALAQWRQYGDAVAQAAQRAHDDAHNALAAATRQLREGVAASVARAAAQCTTYTHDACAAHEADAQALHACMQTTRDEVAAALRALADAQARTTPPQPTARVHASVQTEHIDVAARPTMPTTTTTSGAAARTCHASVQTSSMTNAATSPPRPQLDSMLLACDDEHEAGHAACDVAATPRCATATAGTTPSASCTSSSAGGGCAANEVRNAVADALRDVLRCALPASPATSMTPSAVAATPSATLYVPITPASTPRQSTGASLRGLDALHDAEQRRVRKAQRQIAAERRLLDERARMLHQLRREWKADVVRAKREGVRATSTRGKALQQTRNALDAHMHELERDTAALRQSEAWLHSKQAHLATLHHAGALGSHNGADDDGGDVASVPTTPACVREPLADALTRIEQQLHAVRALVVLQQRHSDPYAMPSHT